MGRCATGEICRIWDWSLASGDTVILDVVQGLPTGDDTMRQIWDGVDTPEACQEIPGARWEPDLCSLPGYESKIWCEFWGGDWDAEKCTSVFLKGALEIVGDFIGNENGLCESDETCLLTPNIGAYQGHGDLEPAGQIGEGAALERITLLKHVSNGE